MRLGLIPDVNCFKLNHPIKVLANDEVAKRNICTEFALGTGSKDYPNKGGTYLSDMKKAQDKGLLKSDEDIRKSLK